MAEKTPKVLEYASQPGQQPARWIHSPRLQILMAICLITSLCAGFSSVHTLRQNAVTDEYIRYSVQLAFKNANHPGSVGAPFVGRKYFAQSVWELPSTYIAFGSAIALILLLGFGLRFRPRQLSFQQ